MFCWHQTSQRCFNLGNELGKLAHLRAKFGHDMQEGTEADLSAGGGGGRCRKLLQWLGVGWSGEGLELGSVREIQGAKMDACSEVWSG